MHKMYCGMSYHSQHQALTCREMPMTFIELGINRDLGKELIGEEGWTKVFPAEPCDQTAVPRALLQLFDTALWKHPEIVHEARRAEAVKVAADLRLRAAAADRGYQAY